MDGIVVFFRLHDPSPSSFRQWDEMKSRGVAAKAVGVANGITLPLCTFSELCLERDDVCGHSHYTPGKRALSSWWV